MDNEIKPLKLDTGESFDALVKAMKELLLEYAGMISRDITFEVLGEDAGLAFYADSGALVMSETKDILGGYEQRCEFPIYIVYRTASTNEKQKMTAQTMLDTLGRWLCGEPVTINGKTETLTEYPALTEERKITRITRYNAYSDEANANKVQDWKMPVTVEYTNEIKPKW